MDVCFDNMRYTCDRYARGYTRALPYDVPRCAVQGFLISGVIHLCLNHGLKMAFVAGSMAATATLVDALIRPIIAAVIPQDSVVGVVVGTFSRIVISMAAGATLGTTLAPALGVVFQSAPLISYIAYMALNFAGGFEVDRALAYPF